jgi:tetratricopeptide (TPR) repeat protein
MDATETLVRRATEAFNSGQPDEAQRLCEQGLAREPGDPVLHHLLAAVLFSRNAIAPAHAHIEVSLAKRPGNAAARLLAARIARSEGNFDVALAHIDAAIATSPQREMFVEKARTLDQAGLRAQARESWRAILKVIPGHQEAAARLGRLTWEDGDPATAANLLEQAVATGAPASVWFDLGVARQDLRDHTGAASAYRKAFELKPDHAEAALNLGIALQESGAVDDAMRAFAQAYRLRPQLFGSIAMALTSASHGRLWLDEDGLRRALGD